MKKRKGFTLIELLVVMAILSILAALLLPAIQRAKQMARHGLCAGHLNQLGKAFFQYINDYGGYMFNYGGVIQFNWGVLKPNNNSWMDMLYPYLSTIVGGRESYPDTCYTERTEVYRCGALKHSAMDDRPYLSSYILNSRLHVDSQQQATFDLGRLKYPPRVVLLYDRNKWTGEPTDADMTDEWGNSGGPDGYGPGGLWYYHSGGPDFSGPHERGYNVLFCDGHVDWFGRWNEAKMTRHAEQ